MKFLILILALTLSACGADSGSTNPCLASGYMGAYTESVTGDKIFVNSDCSVSPNTQLGGAPTCNMKASMTVPAVLQPYELAKTVSVEVTQSNAVAGCLSVGSVSCSVSLDTDPNHFHDLLLNCGASGNFRWTKYQ
jgi:hypothetical protein